MTIDIAEIRFEDNPQVVFSSGEQMPLMAINRDCEILKHLEPEDALLIGRHQGDYSTRHHLKLYHEILAAVRERYGLTAKELFEMAGRKAA